MAERIGFIGVGLMGHGIARNLLEKGHELTVLAHRRRDGVEDLLRRGAREASSAAELARQSDMVFLCVTGSPEVESQVRGAHGIAAGARRGLIVVDCSTSEPQSTLALAAELEPLGVAFCDAPLGGTSAQAEEGKLSAMVGCDEELWPRLSRVIACWAGNGAVRVGLAGSGHKMKLLMNFMSLGYVALYSELLAVARRIDVSPQAVEASLRGTRMDCGVFQTYFRWVLQGEEAHKFTIRNAHKDMKYLAALAGTAGVANPIGAAVRNYYAAAEAAGHGDRFVPTMWNIVAAMNETSTPSG